MRRIIIKGLMVSAVFYLPTAMAESKTEKEIKFRQSAMMFMRWNMGKINHQVVENPQQYNKEQVIAAANVISAVASSGLGQLFSEDSKQGKGWQETKVKPEFFEQPDEVKKLANTFKEEANKLADVAKSGNVDNIKDQFDKTFKACKSCHKKFRKKEEK